MKCLACHGLLDGEDSQYHPKCVRNVWEAKRLPDLPAFHHPWCRDGRLKGMSMMAETSSLDPKHLYAVRVAIMNSHKTARRRTKTKNGHAND